MSLKEVLDEVQKRAERDLLEMGLDLVKAQMDEDLTYGDIELKSGPDFVLFYQDLLDRGVIPHLEIRAPRLAKKWATRFDRESRVAIGLRE